MNDQPLLRVEGLKVHFPVMQGIVFKRQVATVRAVDGVSFSLQRGETLGLVGESGCGKSTTGLAVLRMLEPTAGSIAFEGQDISHHDKAQMRPLRREMQVVFQDPYSSLSPRLSIAQIVGEGLRVHRLGASESEQRRLIETTLEEVGLDPASADRYPHEFSGGQRQRIGIARALASNPKLLIGDRKSVV